MPVVPPRIEVVATGAVNGEGVLFVVADGANRAGLVEVVCCAAPGVVEPPNVGEAAAKGLGFVEARGFDMAPPVLAGPLLALDGGGCPNDGCEAPNGLATGADALLPGWKAPANGFSFAGAGLSVLLPKTEAEAKGFGLASALFSTTALEGAKGFGLTCAAFSP